MRRSGICLFVILFVCLAANGQQQLPEKITARNPIDSAKIFIPATPYFFGVPAVSLSPKSTISTVPGSYYYNSLGFFCKQEIQLEKAIKFPVKMRLGSVSYTDKMEGKITTRNTEP